MSASGTAATIRVEHGKAGAIIPQVARSQCANLIVTGFGDRSYLADRSPWSTLSHVISDVSGAVLECSASSCLRLARRPVLVPMRDHMPTLLILDDSEDLLTLRSALFCSVGFKVIPCADPWKALAVLSASQIDIVVTDYDMPEMDGLSFAERARAMGYGGPIIMSTGSLMIPGHARQWISQIVDKASPPQALLHAVRAYSGFPTSDSDEN
jgi:CheY-like chemotaxis protein